jgi:hypothetical protein
MIYSDETLNKELKAIDEWNETIHLRNIEELMAKLEQPPKPCDAFECDSYNYSGDRCQCMREVFDNEQHLMDYQNFLQLLLSLLITDTMLCGYLYYEDHEEKE